MSLALVLFLTSVVDLDVLAEVHSFLEIGCEATRVRDAVLVILSHFPHHAILMHSGKVLLMNQLFQEAWLTLFVVDKLAPQSLLFALLDIVD